MLKKMTGGNNLQLKTVKKVDMSQLPPCRISLLPHIRRVNHRVAQWKRSNLLCPEIPPPPRENGWLQGEQFLEPMWSDGPILPSSLVDVVETVEDSDLNSDDEDIVSMDETTYSPSSDSDID